MKVMDVDDHHVLKTLWTSYFWVFF